jgi:hypothetical protein
MLVIVLATLVSLILFIWFFYIIIPDHMPAMFWGKVELFWVMISFLGVLYGMIEVLNVDQRIAYEEMHNAARIDFEEAQILIGEHLPVLDHKGASEGQRAGSQWFHTMVSLMDEGYDSRKWEDFVNYTESYVFQKRGFHVNERMIATRYHWPQDPGVKSTEIGFRREIQLIADKLEKIEIEKEKLLKQAPSSKPVTWPRYLIAFVFLIALSLKILKIRHEAYR